MTWTRRLPMRAGWYWWRPSDNTADLFRKRLPPGIYFLESIRMGDDPPELFLALPKDRNRYPIKMMAGEWVGPIEEPKEEEESCPA